MNSDSLNQWFQQGQDIHGTTVGDQLGFSVALSSDGRVLATGAVQGSFNWLNQYPADTGYVRVFLYKMNKSNGCNLAKRSAEIVMEIFFANPLIFQVMRQS